MSSYISVARLRLHEISHTTGQTFKVRVTKPGGRATFTIRHTGKTLVNSRELLELRQTAGHLIPWVEASIENYLNVTSQKAENHAHAA